MVTELSVGNGVLAYSISEKDGLKEATIEYYRGKDVAVTVPELIEDCPVVCIGKKAFLSAKTLSRIVIPQSVLKIGDWAFASCSRLTELVLPRKSLEIGNGVFRECVMLEKIVLTDDDGSQDDSDICYLLAAAVSRLDAQYLFDTVNAGSLEWIEHFDSTTLQMLMKEDSDGFSKMLLCGEEDYVGDDSNFDTYCLMRQKDKVRMLLLRLLHSEGISSDIKERFVTYIRDNMDSVTWKVVVEEHGDEREYFDLLLDCDCINQDNVSRLIESMGERNTGMKGYLMKVKTERMSGGSFMDELDL
ncbi:MAG: leucine-rich repeat domain-containing protein [Lachnospiraceae bacterium]|nr:leucine-rich repeat domain-containing protein [Lachnospiraceae bacterium]